MTDFFGALEQELHAAATRRPRRRLDVPAVAGWTFAAALTSVALAIVGFFVLSGDAGERTTPPAVQPDPVGTVIKKGEGQPPRRWRSIVVANGTIPGFGPWQLEFSRSTRQFDAETGVMYEPAHLPCLTFVPVRAGHRGASGYCGRFPRTPGFSRSTLTVEARRPAGERPRPVAVIVYGHVPARAASVVVRAPGGMRLEVEPFPGPPRVPGDFYVVRVDGRRLLNARVNWLDADGRPGSRGIGVAPGSAGLEGSTPPRDARPSSAP
jgi:hypothetical protein